MGLQAGLDPASTRFDISTECLDVAAAFPGERGSTEQYDLARPGEVRQMRVQAGSDAARRDVAARRPDILGAFTQDLSLLRHRGCCREQHDDADRKNILLHRLSPDVLTDNVAPVSLWQAAPIATRATSAVKRRR
jgi:hypothetical protein